MAPTTSDEFEGDDFSNNLFSDLAPLLTLFGEQVTKQFLSMSMGWADNVLLAMGPLGIITTIVSAIRVGGGKRLKALIGRARESYAVAEQELLSSTSKDVCEMWNGNQIVRLIGSAEDMRTFVISGDGATLDIRTAIQNNPSQSSSDIRILTRKGHSPNLTLNVQGATASTLELWTWALLGAVLQLFSIAFAGMATYHFKWSKAEAQVAEYGYPCFCVGTTCLIIAIIACGRVIEGVTDEMTWSPWDNDEMTRPLWREDTRIITLQKARTVGDQHFPSCAIFMAGHGRSLKFSRLSDDKEKEYRFIVTISTSLAIVGYIVQFIGLRALHWSATIAQLGITLIMTGIRAWVRRGLATDPNWCPLIVGREEASLALLIHHSSGDMPNASSLQMYIKKARRPLFEFIFLYLPDSLELYEPDRSPDACPPQTSLNFEGSNDHEEDTALLKIYSRISNGIPLGEIDKEASALSDMFFNVVRNSMDVLEVSGALTWKTDLIYWVFDFSAIQLPNLDHYARQKISFRLERSPDRAEYRWTLFNHDLIAALLSLSAQALSTRLKQIHRVEGGENLSIGDGLFHVDDGVPYHPSSSGRIVGNTGNDYSPLKREMLEKWLDAYIHPRGLFPHSYRELECYLGMFLASPHQDHPRAKHLVIQTRRDSGLLLQWTQELFSVFMLAIASKVKQVPGKTKEVEGEGGEGNRCFKNSVFDKIANVVVKEGLAHDRDEAYTLIVPAFAHHGLLPTCSNQQAAGSTSEKPKSPAPSNSEENTP